MSAKTSGLVCAHCGRPVPRKAATVTPDGRAYCKKHGGRLPRWAHTPNRTNPKGA